MIEGVFQQAPFDEKKEGLMKKEVNWCKVGALGNIGLIILNIINLTINIMR